jgi:glycosyltransferase involved in cell wall biosynthesis
MFGPHEDPDPRLFKIPRVSVRPAVAFDRLPSIAEKADLLIMPYGDMLATRAMQPLKLKEYLATGLPVVVRDLPATRPWADACDVCDSREQFIEAVIGRLDSGVPIEQKRARLRLEAESWRAKAEVLERVMDNSAIEASAALQS